MSNVWSAVGSTPLSVRGASHPHHLKSFDYESQSGGKPTALQKLFQNVLQSRAIAEDALS